MATAYETITTGVIVKTLKNISVVSVSIDGSPKAFSFSKTIFYVFGLKCDGDMSNLLEDGMEVDICYRVRPGTKPTILLVWLGDKPVVEDQALKTIYDQKGFFSHVLSDDYVIDSDDGKVLVNKGIIFRDGQRTDTLTTDEAISFDAAPIQDFHISGALHEATCAWIGTKPRLVERFNLQTGETEAEFDGVVSGTVGVIPNDVVALVDVEIDAALIKVMLFRKSFKPACDRIQDIVDVGDRLCMRVNYGYVFPGRKQWFAQRAVKTSNVVSLDMLDEVCDVQLEDVTCDIPPEPVATATTTCDTRSTVETGTIAKLTSQISLKPTVHFDVNSEVLYNDPPLTGVLSSYRSDARITYGDLKIFVDRSNLYLDGQKYEPIPLDAHLGHDVHFEAVLRTRTHEFTHEATCAWIGKKPTLAVIAAPLPPPRFELVEENQGTNFYGIVTKLCLPRITLVVIPGEFATVSVHVKNFVTQPEYPSVGPHENFITSYVKLDDWIQFKVRRVPQIPKFIGAYDARPAVFTKETWDKIGSGILVSRGPCDPPTAVPANTPCQHEKPTRKATAPESTAASAISRASSYPDPAVCIASPFKGGCLSQNRAFLISCLGTVKVYHDNIKAETNFVTLEHAFGSSKLNAQTLYIHDNTIVDIESAGSLNDRHVRFDAETGMSPNYNANFVIRRMWNNGDARPPSEVVLSSILKLSKDVSTRFCPGKVTSIPLHDTAIATVKNVPVLVPFDSLVTLQEVNLGCSSIDTLLNVGDCIGVKFEKRNFPAGISGSYFRAVSCWTLSKGGEKISPDDQIRVSITRINSWFNKWGYGQFYGQGLVKNIDGRYCVNYSSKTLNVDLILDIFEKGNVFVNGEMVEFDKFKQYCGKKITFHVAHEYLEKLCDDKSADMFTPKGMFIACSWIGEQPSAKHVFKDELVVPKGSICSNWMYEVVIHSFPWPTHAICHLGYIPVLVPLPQRTQSGTFVGVNDVNLKRGDRVVVRILEELVGDSTVLISNDSGLTKVSDCSYDDVLKNVAGKVVQIPNPTGLIQAHNGGFTASFELCHLRRFRKGPHTDKKWFEGLNGKIPSGKVYFSAVKVNAKTAPYRAFEVYFV